MPGCYLHVWLFLFAIAKETFGVTVQTGLYSRVELTGEKLDQHTADSLLSVEWTKRKASSTCLCFQFTKNNGTRLYSSCCRRAHFYLNNNSLILENVTAQVEGIFTETIVTVNGTTKSLQNFTLNILYPPNVTGILVSWTSNTSVSVRCEVTGSFTYLMWKREDSSILEDNRHSLSERNQTLHISNITSSDCGTYSCVATNAYGQSETQTRITSENNSMHCENSAHQEEHVTNVKPQITSGLALIGALGLCIVMFCGVYRYQHSRRGENDSTDEGDADVVIFQEVPGMHEVSPLPFQIHQAKTGQSELRAAEPLEDFETGPAGREETIILYCSSSDEHARKE